MSMTDKKLLRITKSFRHGLLGRKDSDFQCFVVSAPLEAFLRHEYKFDTKLISGEVRVQSKPGRFMPLEHFWLELPDGRILDPTHDQFGYDEKVYLGPLPDNFKPYETNPRSPRA